MCAFIKEDDIDLWRLLVISLGLASLPWPLFCCRLQLSPDSKEHGRTCHWPSPLSIASACRNSTIHSTPAYKGFVYSPTLILGIQSSTKLLSLLWFSDWQHTNYHVLYAINYKSVLLVIHVDSTRVALHIFLTCYILRHRVLYNLNSGKHQNCPILVLTYTRIVYHVAILERTRIVQFRYVQELCG